MSPQDEIDTLKGKVEFYIDTCLDMEQEVCKLEKQVQELGAALHEAMEWCWSNQEPDPLAAEEIAHALNNTGLWRDK